MLVPKLVTMDQWIGTCPPKACVCKRDRQTYPSRAPWGMEEGEMMGWHLSWAGRAFLAELTAGAKDWGHVDTVVQNRSLSCWGCERRERSTGARGLLLLIPKDKETGLDGNSKCQMVQTTLLSPRVEGMASLTDIPPFIL